MINFENLYEDTKAELVVATDYIKGKNYITEDGTRVKYLGTEDDSLKFKIVTSSPLIDSAKISKFEKPNGLALFWRCLEKVANNDYPY
jgi:hypothetical protein